MIRKLKLDDDIYSFELEDLSFIIRREYWGENGRDTDVIEIDGRAVKFLKTFLKCSGEDD